MSIIEVQNISKSYTIGKMESYGSLRDEVMQAITSPFRRSSIKDNEDNTIWALKDVSFEVKEGEALGIIGRNGAGKSTLLKILSRITEPTEGRITMRGRVASLLEVGTGFHPELTGRENILLNGALLGMTRQEIRSKFDEIVAFAEIEKFLDTPVKRYSSGMYVRLAFAVAAHLEPEILVVDEVLAVGDVAFQKKCLGKMGDVAKGGRTVLFVSHNMAAVNSLCSNAIVLERGSIVYKGNAGSAVKHYLESSAGGEGQTGNLEFVDNPDLPIQVKHISIVNEGGQVCSLIDYQRSYSIEVGIEVRKRDRDYYGCIHLHDLYGNLIVFTADDDLCEPQIADLDTGEFIIKTEFPAKILKPGSYYISVNLNTRSEKIDNHRHVLFFEIQDNQSVRGIKGGYRRPAIVAPEIPWQISIKK